MSCSTSAANCCQQPIVSVCLAQQNYPLGSAGSTLFGPNPTSVAASGVLSNESANSAVLTFTFRRGTTVVATMAGLAAGQFRAFAVPGFTSISVTSTVAGGIADLCMTEFFRPSL